MARIPRKIAGLGASDLPDATAFDAYVGPAREITVDQQRGIIALHDGTTLGGYQFRKDDLDLIGPVVVTAADALEAAGIADGKATAAQDDINEAQLRKNNLTANRAPLPTDDETQGYAVGSRWLWQGQEWMRSGHWQETTSYDVQTLSSLIASQRSYPLGSIITTHAEGYSYEVVATPADAVTAGGVYCRRVPASISTNDAQASNKPYFAIHPASASPGTNHLFVSQDTTVRGDATMVFLQRNVNSDNGLSNPKALRVKTNVNVDTNQTEWAISGELDNHSDINGSGSTAVSGVSNKYGLGSVFGGHFQAKDWSIYAAQTDVTAVIGAELNTPCIGLDHPTANNGLGVRRVMDIIARTNEQVADWDTSGGNSGDGEIGTGVVIRSDNATDGYFRYGLVIDDISQVGNPNPIGTAMFVRTTGAYGIRFASSSENSTANISLEATTPNGVRASGIYSTGAFVTNDDQHVVFSTDRTKKMRWGSASGRLEFRDGANTRVSFDLSATPGIFVSSSKVLGARQPGWSIPTGTSATGSFNTATVTLEQLAQNVRGLIAALHASGGGNHALIGA